MRAVHVVAGHRRELGYDPLSAGALAANLPDLREHDVYVCGPDGHDRGRHRRAARGPGVPRRQIHHETFEF